MYFLKINVLITSPEENANLEAEIAEEIDACLVHKDANFISYFSEDIIGENYGKCSVCGTWVSNHNKTDSIAAFSNGAIVENEWYCDICIPPDHPVAF